MNTGKVTFTNLNLYSTWMKLVSYYSMAHIAIYTILTPVQRKLQGYILNIPWEPVYIMIYPVAMVYRQYKYIALEDISPLNQRVFFDLSSLLADIDQFFI